MNVELVKEHEDGSAVYQFDLPKEVLEALTRQGIITALKEGIKEAEQYSPTYVPPNADMTEEIKELARKAGFALWENESWRPPGAIIDWHGVNENNLIAFYNLVKQSMSSSAEYDAVVENRDESIALLKACENETTNALGCYDLYKAVREFIDDYNKNK